MQTYAGKKRSNAPAPQEKAVENISRSDMLRISGAGAPQPMSPALREKFEPGFGADFSNIRISRGHIPEELGVQAVAKGTDILLDSRAGMDVLGHELAHVVQQAQGQVQSGYPVVHDAALERQADVMGARAASGESAMAGGMSGFGGGMMSIAPMSGAEAPAQCKSGKNKNKDAPAAAPVQTDAERWHSQLIPAAQQYINPIEMTGAPTASPAEMLKQVHSREEYYDVRNARSTQFTEAMKAHPNAGSMGRRMEAMFDPSGTEEAAAYNSMMMDTYDQVEQINKENPHGGVSMSPEMTANMGRIMQPLVQQITSIGGGSADEFKQYAKDNYGDSKFLIGKLHALPDTLKTFDEASRDAVMKAAGYSGSYADFTKLAQPVNSAFGQGWTEAGKAMGTGGNQIFRNVEGASMNGTRKVGDRAGVIAPKAGQRYVTQKDLPQSGPGWEHTGSWKNYGKSFMGVPVIEDVMPGGSKNFGAPAPAQAPGKRSLGDRILYHKANLPNDEGGEANGRKRGLFRLFSRKEKGNIL